MYLGSLECISLGELFVFVNLVTDLVDVALQCTEVFCCSTRQEEEEEEAWPHGGQNSFPQGCSQRGI